MKKVKKIVTILVLIILLPILFVSTVILVDSYTHKDKIPSFFGWKPFIVLSGSMETEIYPGDIVVVKNVNTDTLKVNDIIAYKNDNVVITHRIVSINYEEGETRYITKGDNNNVKDVHYVLPNQVEGIYKFRIKKLGNLAMFLQTPIGMIVGLSIPVIILILVQAIDNKKSKKQIKNREKELQEEIARLKKEKNED